MTLFHIVADEQITRTYAVNASSLEEAFTLHETGRSVATEVSLTVASTPVVIVNTHTNEEFPV